MIRVHAMEPLSPIFLRKNMKRISAFLTLLLAVVFFGGCLLTGCAGNAGSVKESSQNDREFLETLSLPDGETETQSEKSKQAGNVSETTDATADQEEQTPAQPEGNAEKKSREVISEEKVLETVSLWKPEGEIDTCLMPDSSERLLTREELAGYSKTRLRLIRNEIAARHGWDFSDDSLKAYFYAHKWYHPNYGGNAAVSFTEVETENMQLLDALESEIPLAESADVRVLDEFVPLESNRDYDLVIGGHSSVLRITPVYIETNSWLNNLTAYTGISLNGQEIHSEIIGLYSAYLYNLSDKSYLFLSGRIPDNDIVCTDVFLLTENGISTETGYGGEILEHCGNGALIWSRYWDVGCRDITEWIFIADSGTKVCGRSVFGWGELQLMKDIACYKKTENGVTKLPLKAGDTIILDSIDNRYRNSLNAKFLTIILPEGEMACIPLFGYEPYPEDIEYTEDGDFWPDLFDMSLLIWGGLY